MVTCASGGASAASASAARRRTSRCCATLCVDAPRLARRARVRGRDRRDATCCPAPRRPSSRSSAPGACAASPERLVGGLGFILPGLVADPRARGAVPRRLAARLGARRRARAPAPPSPPWRVQAGAPAWCRRAGGAPRAARRAGSLYALARRRVAAATVGPWLVLVLLALRRRRGRAAARGRGAGALGAPRLAAARGGRAAATGGLPALAWVAFKVGALSYGGGFVIIPLMQADAVDTLPLDDRRAVPQRGRARARSPRARSCTPSPSSATPPPASAAALLAAAVAFAPSFSFILLGADRFDRLRANPRVRAFLDGAGPAAIGAIARRGRPARARAHRNLAVRHPRRGGRRALLVRRGVVLTLIAAGAAGAIASALGAPLPS